MLENCLNDGQVMASQLSAGPQAAWPGSVGHRQGLPGCRSQHPSRKKHRMLVALDVYGQMNTLCKAKALHLRTCSAPWAPCLPCQCPGRARGPGSPSLSKSSNHSGSETDPSHSRTSVSRAWQRDWHSLQLSSALDWVRQEPPPARCREPSSSTAAGVAAPSHAFHCSFQGEDLSMLRKLPAVFAEVCYSSGFCDCPAAGLQSGDEQGAAQAPSLQSGTHVERGLRRG